MTNKEYEQRLEALEREIAALRQEVVEDGVTPKPPHPRWKPEEEEQYYTINVGYACAGLNYWDCDTLDGDIYSLGFVFKTEAEAEFAIERLKVLAEMREWAGKWDDPWVMIYDGWSPKAILIHAPDVTFGELRFATREDAEGCIKAVGKDRLIKYYFGVRDHEIPDKAE